MPLPIIPLAALVGLLYVYTKDGKPGANENKLRKMPDYAPGAADRFSEARDVSGRKVRFFHTTVRDRIGQGLRRFGVEQLCRDNGELVPGLVKLVPLQAGGKTAYQWCNEAYVRGLIVLASYSAPLLMTGEYDTLLWAQPKSQRTLAAEGSQWAVLLDQVPKQIAPEQPQETFAKAFIQLSPEEQRTLLIKSIGCEVCKNFAWTGEMMPTLYNRDLHHPACRTMPQAAPPIPEAVKAEVVKVEVVESPEAKKASLNGIPEKSQDEPEGKEAPHA